MSLLEQNEGSSNSSAQELGGDNGGKYLNPSIGA